MKYETPKIPEGINVSKTHPLKTFTVLIAGMLAVLLLSAWLLGLGGGYLAKKLPYSQELRLAETYQEVAAPQTELLFYLQQLADRVAAAMELSDSMPVTIHYVSEPVDNAFATIGGNIFLYKGLLQKLPSENTLAMLIAHEIAHVAHRDPIVSVGQNAAISMGMMVLLGNADSGILGSTGLYTQMNFSRDMETAADVRGLNAVQRIYGHVGGALDLYKILESVSADSSVSQPEFFSTHPQSSTRLDDLNNLIQKHSWQQSPDVKLLPDDFSAWLSEG
ncbi:M48 family metallopeptidase [Leucothrix pacifica]|uniref:Peptidase M48 domain-containing protein n=1 Tax=Leucothrix pacifica TaxID=1247513 RepID=A0A317CNL8_9GAMM|nr:M48 family metallopeptidase [Leucothrix pacifica]PWR00107.1 hypothetical protein DKW60_02925 [Leucothrix pacifica]